MLIIWLGLVISPSGCCPVLLLSSSPSKLNQLTLSCTVAVELTQRAQPVDFILHCCCRAHPASSTSGRFLLMAKCNAEYILAIIIAALGFQGTTYLCTCIWPPMITAVLIVIIGAAVLECQGTLSRVYTCTCR